jgi:tetrahydromethanopterin S-methyltransferase subunit B
MIRSKGILPLIATSNGYYCSYDKQEIMEQIKSLQERADAIINSANGLKKFL